jgi:hypothetical protein
MFPVGRACCRGVLRRSLLRSGLLWLGGMIGLAGGRVLLWNPGYIDMVVVLQLLVAWVADELGYYLKNREARPARCM